MTDTATTPSSWTASPDALEPMDCAAEISITPLGPTAADRADVIEMIMEASRDPSIGVQNYLRPTMDAHQARAWCVGAEGVVMQRHGTPVGVALVHPHPDPGEGVVIPPEYGEFEIWVVARHRDQRIFQRAYALVTRAFALRYEGLVAVVWEDNKATMALLRRFGWHRLGRSYWKQGETAGFCEVYACDLRHRPHANVSLAGSH